MIYINLDSKDTKGRSFPPTTDPGQPVNSISKGQGEHLWESPRHAFAAVFLSPQTSNTAPEQSSVVADRMCIGLF